MKNLFFLLLALPSFLSCNSAINGLFGGKDKTPHEIYADKIDEKPGGKQWMEVSNNILQNTKPVQLPYKQLGYFPADKPRALALEFTAKRGEQIIFDLRSPASTVPVVYADVFKDNGSTVDHIASADEDSSHFSFDVEETGTYILRL